MNKCEALIIGGSAGSLSVLLSVLPELREELNFPVIIVLHRKPGKDSILTDLLSSKTKLRVKEVEEKEKILNSTVYIAPPNYHLLIEKDRSFSLDASEKVNFSRPSIDVTFESASEVFAENNVCLLLSGANSDGTAGLRKVKENGGMALVQNPESAVAVFMPQNALQSVEIDEVLEVKNMGAFINNLN